MRGLGFALLVLMGVGFAQTRLPTGNWVLSAESAHFRYCQLAEQASDQALTPQQVQAALSRLESFFELAAPLWDFPSDQKIEYYKFASVQDMVRYGGGQEAIGKVIPRERKVFSLLPSHAHEIAHILSIPGNKPIRMSNFWLEGLAEYYAWPWVYSDNAPYQASIGARNGRSLHYWAQKMLQENKLPSIPHIAIFTSRFEQLDIEEGYPVAGSFISFLLKDGLAQVSKFRELMYYWNTYARNEQDVLSAFEKIFSMTLPQAEARWHQFLRNWDESSLR